MNNYLHHTINRKKIFIYLKKGRVLLLLFIILSFWVNNNKDSYNKLVQINQSLGIGFDMIVNLPMIFLVSTFSLILIPVVFKNGRFVLFWLGLLGLVISVVIWELVVFFWYDYNDYLSVINYVSLFGWLLKKHIIILLSTAGILFFVEQVEEIQLLKDMYRFNNIRKSSYEKLMGTRTELPFIINQLRAVRSQLSSNPEQGRASLLSFADILRYKLYDYDSPSIDVEEELIILEKLINTSQNDEALNTITLEIERPIQHHHIIKSSLINPLLPIINNHSKLDGTIEIFIVTDDKLHIIIEISTLNSELLEQIISQVREQTEIYGYLPIEINTETQKKIINLCHQTLN